MKMLQRPDGPVKAHSRKPAQIRHDPRESACALTAHPLDQAPCTGHPIFMLIYKIFRADEWQALCEAGSTLGAPIDLSDGYIHFSTAEQAAETAAKHFAGAQGLVLAAIETAALGADLKWEPSRGGALFPHLYRALSLNEVEWHAPLTLIDGTHQFPEQMV